MENVKIATLGVAASLLLVLATLAPVSAASAADVTVSGTVTGTAGPEADIRVGWYVPSNESEGHTFTDESGQYSLNIPASLRNYYLSVNVFQDGAYAETDSSEYNGEYVGAGGDHDYLFQVLQSIAVPTAGTVDLSLTRPGSITGRSTALSGSTLELRNLGGDTVDEVEVASDGSFAFGGLIPGRYKAVSAGKGSYLESSSSPVKVEPGRSTTLSISPAQGGRITGVVKGAGKAAKGVTVSATSGARSYSVKTAANGSYSLAGLAAGDFTLAFGMGESGSPDGSLVPKTQKVKGVSTGSSRTINASLAKGSTITGKVKLTSGATTYRVVAVNSRKQRVSSVTFASSKKSFSIPGLAAGKHTIYITDSKATKWASKSVSVKAGKSKSAGTVKLKKKAVVLSGTIKGAKGGEVFLSSSLLPRTDDTLSETGSYRFGGLVPGTYSVAIAAEGFAEKTTSVTLKKSTKKTLAPGAAYGTVTARLRIGGRDLEYGFGVLATRGAADREFDVYEGRFSEQRPAGESTISAFGSYSVPLQAYSPFWFEFPASKKSFSLSSGKTTGLGTFDLEVHR